MLNQEGDSLFAISIANDIFLARSVRHDSWISGERNSYMRSREEKLIYDRRGGKHEGKSEGPRKAINGSLDNDHKR